jgi:hypothetical protein
MKILWAALALLVATNAAPLFAKGGAGEGAKKGKTSTPAADPNTAVAKAHGGKVWFLAGTPPGAEGVELSKWLSSHASVGEVSKKPNEERWPINYLAVFKKPPAKGPMTIEFVDKKEPGTLVAQDASQTPGGALVFQEPYDLDANNGFNKGHTYIMKVGQLIKGRFVTYATGEISLK